MAQIKKIENTDKQIGKQKLYTSISFRIYVHYTIRNE